MVEVTSHAVREARRQAEIAEREATVRPTWVLLGRPLVHIIRKELDVSLVRDLYWLELCRDTQGEELLAELRPRVHTMRAAHWGAIRRNKPHVWRVLLDWQRGHAALCLET